MNVFGYIDKYGDRSFKELKLNNIDYLIFSLISYLDFDGIVSTDDKNKVSIGYAGHLYFNKYNEDYFKYLGLGIRSAIKVFRKAYLKDRYRDLKLYNYVYACSSTLQFSAVVIDLDSRNKVISFEGTDDLIAGWKEDFAMSYKFPVEAQSLAIKYLNKNIKSTGSTKYVVCGHSKGGNLALVSSMYVPAFKRRKIKKIYSFDGPGLREKQLKSRRYKSVYKKYYHIIPNTSIVGQLFLDNKYTVIKSNKSGVLGHDAITWMICDDDFLYTTITKRSHAFYETFNGWLKKYDDKTRKKFVNHIFGIFEKCNITSVSTFNARKLDYVMDLISEMKDLDEDTKEQMKLLLSMIFSSYKDAVIESITNKK